LRYWAAMAELREPIVDDDATMNLLPATFAGRVEWDEKKLGPLLDSNLDAIRTMQQATKLPECSWGFDYRHGERTPVWFLMRARRLAQLNGFEGMREMGHGDSQTAVNTWLAGFKFVQDVSRSGPVIVALVAGAMILDNQQPLRNSARQGKLSEQEKKELSAFLKAMPEGGFDWGLPWGVECAIGEQFLQQLRTSGNPKAVYEKYGIARRNEGSLQRRRRFVRTSNICFRRKRLCVSHPARRALVRRFGIQEAPPRRAGATSGYRFWSKQRRASPGCDAA